ncbi:MAG: hypothetical protein LBS42_08890 [Tannerella sp.]|jgi:hypothetical protein|nr:hypothetical protein [Tannerella sp.]
MSVIETILARRSVRSYTGEPLSAEHAELVASHIAGLKAPFGAKARIRLIHAQAGESEKVKLGTYGWIGGARDYLALVYEEGPMAGEGAAWMFEQAILYCTGLGLGTCWLGGTFNRKDFVRQVALKPDETLRIVSPIGYPSGRKRFVETYIVGAEKKHRTRKPFGATFFHRDFLTPLAEAQAGVYALPFEMVRLAPSANNMQPWRAVLDGDTVHFYRTFSFGFSSIDMGIALCHFGETCREKGIAGHFEIRNMPDDKNFRYTISWTGAGA